jgi:hypothetical protein
MIMPHYIYTREGAADAMRLGSVNNLKYYIKKAKAAGCEPSKIIGGIEYFDMDLLLDPPASDKYINNIKVFVKKQMEKRKKGAHLQLRLFE